MYIEKPTSAAVTFDSITCSNNIATVKGGCVYWYED
jgi:hypothetical protein